MSKTGAPLKGVFEPAKAQAAQAIMHPPAAAAPPEAKATPTARNRKAGGRGVRISGYVSAETDEALRDEVIRRTVASRRTVSLNDVLCSVLDEWAAKRGAA